MIFQIQRYEYLEMQMLQLETGIAAAHVIKLPTNLQIFDP